MNRGRSALPRTRGERGYSSIELVLYMPLLLGAIVVTVQFALIYLANEYASVAAREANRVARVTGDPDQGTAKGHQVVDEMGDGLLAGATVRVRPIGDETVETVVTGHAPQIIPFLSVVEVSETVRGPIERFDPDVAP